jgi:hypothetical protein
MPTPNPADQPFIRFVVGADGENHNHLDGLFTVSRNLRDEGQLEPYEVQWLDQVYDWFNAELPCPPFTRCQYPVDAVSWFRCSATRFVARMWDLAALLREHNQPVRLLKSVDPGRILYEDAFQIVADHTHRSRKRRRACAR